MSEALELAARRMTAFLARKPRSAKTRAYLATMPKRPRIVVKPEDYPPVVTRAQARLDELLQAQRDAQRYADWERRGKPPSPSMPRRDRLRPSARVAVVQSPLLVRMVEAQGSICPLCGDKMLLEGGVNDPLLASFDHVVPRSRGGAHQDNRIAAHRQCNTEKGNRMPSGCEMLWLDAVNDILRSRGEA